MLTAIAVLTGLGVVLGILLGVAAKYLSVEGNPLVKEIEDLLVGHPGIADVTVVGLPDPRTGERACVVIVPSGTDRPDRASLATFLGELGVAKFKWPEQVELRAELPRNAAGKVLKHVLQKELSEGD